MRIVVAVLVDGEVSSVRRSHGMLRDHVSCSAPSVSSQEP